MNSYKVVLRGAYGAYNFGDDALLDVIYKSVSRKFSPKDIAIFGSSCSYLKGMYPDSGVLDKFEAANITCKNLVFGGGTQFYDFGKKSGFLDRLSLIKNPLYVLRKILSKKMLPVNSENEIYMAVGLGPFQRDSTVLKRARQQMRAANFISVRDLTSLNYLKGLDVDVVKTVDLCFSKDVSKLSIKRELGSKIGIILRDWDFYHSEYSIESLRLEIDKLKSFYDVDIISFGVDSNLKEKCAEYGYNLISWDPEAIGIDEFISILSFYDVIFSSRYHGVIYSILLEIPVVALPIEPKLKIAANELDGVILYHDEGFLISVKNILSRYDDIRARLSKTRVDNRIIACQTIEKFIEALI
ncbi:polysaccharide pyruvyl transferase family protein [Aeromonas salmonicida]|uniref:polysaccharide pyruvyl transferase family protein n=1 Tax=Aeromonas salmonicida TaxID=645 RepID=UPI00370D5F4D